MKHYIMYIACLVILSEVTLWCGCVLAGMGLDVKESIICYGNNLTSVCDSGSVHIIISALTGNQASDGGTCRTSGRFPNRTEACHNPVTLTSLVSLCFNKRRCHFNSSAHIGACKTMLSLKVFYKCFPENSFGVLGETNITFPAIGATGFLRNSGYPSSFVEHDKSTFHTYVALLPGTALYISFFDHSLQGDQSLGYTIYPNQSPHVTQIKHDTFIRAKEFSLVFSDMANIQTGNVYKRGVLFKWEVVRSWSLCKDAEADTGSKGYVSMAPAPAPSPAPYLHSSNAMVCTFTIAPGHITVDVTVVTSMLEPLHLYRCDKHLHISNTPSHTGPCHVIRHRAVFFRQVVVTYAPHSLSVPHIAIYYKGVEKARSVTCEGSVWETTCPAGASLLFLASFYGRDRYDICEYSRTGGGDGTCASNTSTVDLVAACPLKPACPLTVGGPRLHDPCPSLTKYLQVDYVCMPDKYVHHICDDTTQLGRQGVVMYHSDKYIARGLCMRHLAIDPDTTVSCRMLHCSLPDSTHLYLCGDVLTVMFADHTTIFPHCEKLRSHFTHTGPLKVIISQQIRNLYLAFEYNVTVAFNTSLGRYKSNRNELDHRQIPDQQPLYSNVGLVMVTAGSVMMVLASAIIIAGIIWKKYSFSDNEHERETMVAHYMKNRRSEAVSLSSRRGDHRSAIYGDVNVYEDVKSSRLSRVLADKTDKKLKIKSLYSDPKDLIKIEDDPYSEVYKSEENEYVEPTYARKTTLHVEPSSVRKTTLHVEPSSVRKTTSESGPLTCCNDHKEVVPSAVIGVRVLPVVGGGNGGTDKNHYYRMSSEDQNAILVENDLYGMITE